ncbi:SIMPL domain-containing protein [Pseudoalteromonas sp. MMG010]|uniref:SIMPL domain-containing protein n=1 Tax=Pseudoalteromonas sp. MMG010 TaxID=2822685 RepID=UPI001B3A5C31|nr:SIMPL domain-containing protein [Pseudoalteromonas sp. MMG010]MBQ4832860.1 SIMPL domain-containing protein [Pseudoalteromonas sp. MMG010]
MSRVTNYNLAIAAAILAIGLLGLGVILNSTALAVKAMDRTVVVKGLAERDVVADTVIWPLQFTDADNNLEVLVQRIEQKNSAIIAFLKLHGFDDDEISLGVQSIKDQQTQAYVNQHQKLRYLARSTVTIYSHALDKVKNAVAQISQLAKQNIAIEQDSYQTKIEYIFNGLNNIKPSMVQQATEKAREVAQKFAKDSNSKLGKIKTAHQGQFSIRARDSNTPAIKKVRVVSRVEYYLVD